MDGEQNLLEDKLASRIVRALPSATGALSAGLRKRAGVVLGVGDDAAVLTPAKGRDWVVTTDASLEGIHFAGDLHPADSVGYKALARAASDLAAMGARPRLFFLTLAIPAQRTGLWLDGFLGGMARAARELGLLLAGGDTSKFETVAMSLTVFGDVPSGKAITRAGARPGDVIHVSGKLGRAQFGLELLQVIARNKGKAKTPIGRLALPGIPSAKFARWLQPHLYPAIRLQLGRWLAERGVPSAMMDLSDGFSTDLARLCKASGVGARIQADRIPRVDIAPGKIAGVRAAKLDPLAVALHGGEDYELLFTVPPARVKELRRAPGFSELTAIGEIERGSRVLLVDAPGRARPLRPAGWDSFRRK